MGKRPKILIVDDRVENLIALEKILYDTEADLIRATSGNEALKKLIEEDFALLLIDVQMPGMDGYETVDLMRQDNRYRDLPVIFMSAIYRDDADKIRGVQTGAVDFLTKPLIPEILRGKVDVFLDLYRNRIAMQEEIERRKLSENELKKLHQRLEEINLDLDLKVKQRTRELTEANEALKIEIEERKQAEKSLKEAQFKIIETEKVAALGILTAGIAHELNNPLMGILNFVQYCRKKTTENGKLQEILKDAESATESCIKIVRNLLTFSRMEKGVEEPFQTEDLAVLFDRVLNLLSYRIEKENINIRRYFDSNVTTVPLKITGMQQVLLNLVGNAIDAMDGKEEKEISLTIRKDGHNLIVEIIDTGCGIPPHIISKIFDPFFTTKPVGKGTGLGLSVSRGIVETHGGKLNCKSEPNKNTVFIVELPLIQIDTK